MVIPLLANQDLTPMLARTGYPVFVYLVNSGINNICNVSNVRNSSYIQVLFI